LSDADRPSAPGSAAPGSSTGADGPATPRQLVKKGREFLERHGVEEARLDAELLVSNALGLERLRMFLELDRPVEPHELERARAMLVRRAKGEPTAYVTGVRDFYRHTFNVDRRVLVPRPETELIVDLARDWAKGRLFPSGGPRVLDVGTGSGCLAVTLALELDGSNVVAIDVSPEALELARENAARLGADVGFLEGDGLAPLADLGGRPFDLVVSNPPYVDPAQRASLAREVRDHEPALALFGPADDPDHWAVHLVLEAPRKMGSGGRLLVELGADQWKRLEPRLANVPGSSSVHTDLAGLPRVLVLDLPDA
jgi:release factor glutamine methyltransferase